MTSDTNGLSRTRAFEFTTRRPVAILMSFLAMAVFGAVSYLLLPLSLMPDLTYPSLTVRTEYPGSAPEEVESSVSRPIEQELGVVANLVRISSISRAGVSDVTLDFAWGTQMSRATQEVREKLDQVFLPDDAGRPLILRFDPQLDPVVRLALHGERDLMSLRRYAEEELRRDLEALPGVAAVKVKGGLEEEIRVEIDERRLAAFGLSIADVGSRLAAANVNLAGGNLEEAQTQYIVRTLNEFRSIEEIGDIAVTRQRGAVVRVRDLGRVLRTHVDRDVITRVNGEESIELAVFKEADANIVEVARAVRERVFGTPAQQAFVAAAAPHPAATDEDGQRLETAMTDFLAHRLPAGTSLTLLADQSRFIESALAEVRSTALWGGVLAIVVLYLFLRRLLPTLIIALAIPMSIVATFAPMYWFGVSLNIMSLGGLALGIGMLVDNSVVVLESISRCREEGDELVRSVIRGTGEVGSAVVASTLTTVAVFAPIVFVEGVAGQVFGDLSLTIVFSLLTSLLVALFLVPMLASRPVLSSLPDGQRRRLPAERGTRPLGLRPSAFRDLLAGPGAATLRFLAVGLWGGVAAPLKALLSCGLWWTMPLWALFRTPEPWLHGVAAPQLFGLTARWSAMPDLLCFATLARERETLRGLRAGPARTAPVRALARAYVFLLRAPLVTLLTGLGRGAAAIAAVTLTVAAASAGALLAGALALVRPLAAVFARALDRLRRAYPRLLRASLRAPASTAAVLLLLTAVFLAWVLPRLGRELIPEVRQGLFDVQARLPVGTPLETTDATLRPIERILRETPGVLTVATTVGVDRDEFDPDPEAGEHSARFTVRLAAGAAEDAIVETLRGRVRGIPNVVTKISRPALFTTKTPIEVEVRSDDLATLRRVSELVAARLSALPELSDVKSTLQRGHPEIQIRYDRQRLTRYGLDVARVAELVRNKVQGEVASRLRRGDRRVDIRVRVRPEDRATIEDLRRLVVNPGAANPIRLDAVAELTLAEGPSEVRRVDQRRTAIISANARTDLATATKAIERTLRAIELPGSYTFAITGQREEMERSTRSLAFALSLAVFLVYVVMASQFESLVHPFVILFSIPMAAVGVTAVLYALAIPLSVVVLLGCIMLAGIVVNNAIVLVDYVNHLRRTGVPKIEAIVQAGSVRLRPILMTTCTTVIGLLPMALGLGEGAEIRSPMAITVIAGLATSTVLTLVVVPVVYALLDRRPDLPPEPTA